jgi:NUDIX domain
VDGIEMPVVLNGQNWQIAWHPPPHPPPGVPHGVAAVCVIDADIVLVSGDGERWDLPAGRPEPGEHPIDTLRRELLEEACAAAIACELLGFSRGACVRGREEGLVLVRSMWRADVRLDDWHPRFEITQRRRVPADRALHELFVQPAFPVGLRPLYNRLFAAAGLPGYSPFGAES